jgi:hypothetical protein
VNNNNQLAIGGRKILSGDIMGRNWHVNMPNNSVHKLLSTVVIYAIEYDALMPALCAMTSALIDLAVVTTFCTRDGTKPMTFNNSMHSQTGDLSFMFGFYFCFTRPSA